MLGQPLALLHERTRVGAAMDVQFGSVVDASQGFLKNVDSHGCDRKAHRKVGLSHGFSSRLQSCARRMAATAPTFSLPTQKQAMTRRASACSAGSAWSGAEPDRTVPASGFKQDGC